jgi:imidazolonepropionase-like amidohydrolase
MRFLALALLFASSQDPAPPRLTAWKGARLYTAAGPALDQATILVEGGRIVDVGKDLPVPADAAIVDLAGRVVIPGLIDAASPLLVPPAERAGGSPEYDILDALDRYQTDPQEAVEQGVTTVYVGPTSGGGVGGLGSVVRLDAVRGVVAARGALKVTIPESSGDVSTAAQRYEGYQQLRQVFEGARQYVEANEKYKKDAAEHEAKKKQAEAEKKPAPPAPTKPKPDPRNEILARTLDPKQPLPVRIEAHSADAIGYALKLIDEFKLRAVLEQATEGAVVADAISKAKVPVVTPRGRPRRSSAPGCRSRSAPSRTSGPVTRGRALPDSSPSPPRSRLPEGSGERRRWRPSRSRPRGSWESRRRTARWRRGSPPTSSC